MGTSLTGKTYVVWGAGGGIGSAVVRLLLDGGARVLVAGRRREPLDALAQGFEDSVEVFVGDARESASVDASFAAATSRWGGVDGATLCVGSILLKPAHLTTDAEWMDTVTTNLTSAFWMVRAAGRAMTAHGGSVVLCSSAAARIGLPNHEAIAAAKAGIDGLVRSAAATYAMRQIRVNSVAPGLVRTPLASRVTANPTALKASESMHPLGRIGEPDDVARAIVFLLDPAQAWITGQTLGIDGGLGTVRGR